MPKMEKYAHGQFCWVDLSAHDLGGARKFYEGVFGWDCRVDESDMGPYGMFSLDGDLVGGIGQLSDEMKSAGIPPTWNSYISVDDVEAVTRKAAELGAQVVVPVMEIPEAGKMSFIQPPGQGVVAFWQPTHHCGATRVGDPGCFCWNELTTRDFEGAKKFFADLLGWTYKKHDGSPSAYAIIRNGDRDNGGIMEMTDEWGDMPPFWAVYFHVEDADAAAAKIKELGGSVHHGPFDAPGVGKIAICADPQGGCFNLIRLEAQGG